MQDDFLFCIFNGEHGILYNKEIVENGRMSSSPENLPAFTVDKLLEKHSIEWLS